MIGTFDGVHLGHQRLISMAIEEAGDRGLATTAVTFDPHPLQVLAPDRAPNLLATAATRVRLLEQAGIDDVVVIPFDREIASLPPEEFVKSVLIEDIKVEVAIVGENFRFGREGAGTPDLLAQLLTDKGGSALTSPLLELDGTTISSTEIRNRLACGDVAWVSRALGRPHAVPVVQSERGATTRWRVPPHIQVPGQGEYSGAVRTRSWKPAHITVLPQRDIAITGQQPSGFGSAVEHIRFTRRIR